MEQNQNSEYFMNQLMKYSNKLESNNKKSANPSNIYDAINFIDDHDTDKFSPKKDKIEYQEIFNIMKSYQDCESDDDNKKTSSTVLFSNSLIQTSFSRMINLKKLFSKKEEATQLLKKEFYFNSWKSKSCSNENKKEYLLKNRKIIEAFCDDTTESIKDYDYLNPSSNVNTESKFNYDNDYDFPLQSQLPGDKSLNSGTSNVERTSKYKYNDSSNSNFKIMKIQNSTLPQISCLKNILFCKITNYFSFFLQKLSNYTNSKKFSNVSLSLLYIFTELAISKHKINQINKAKVESNNSNKINLVYEQKLAEYKKEISKQVAISNEKADRIAERNDKIEQQNETIELLTDEINRLNETIEKLEKRSKNLNIIDESLCSKCGNSLEESFMSTQHNHHIISPSNKINEINELKKAIQEQLDVIIRMEAENKELKIKNIEFKSKNELIIGELDIIKKEFNQLSDNFNMKNKNINLKLVENSCQTENMNEQNSNSKNQKFSKTVSSNLKKSSKKYSNKLNIKNSTGNITNNANSNNLINPEKNVTNYNIININNNSSCQPGKFSQTSLGGNNSLLTLSMNDSEKEIVQNLRFDNSILTQEIVSLNKELTKVKNEVKHLTENNKKYEKEKNEFASKLKSKTENFDKIKKENEELMILIQTSNYKSFVTVEIENKKLKTDISNLLNDFDSTKQEIQIKNKKIAELETENEKFKKGSENLNKFKIERENLILENAKFESEVKRYKYDIEEAKNLLERQNIIIQNRDETIVKLNEEVSYNSFNAKKFKQDAEKNFQDAVAYQQICRKIEKELVDCQMKKEKIENELNTIKQHLGIGIKK